MVCHVLDLQEIDQTQVVLVGGKGREPGGAFADRGHPRTARLLREECRELINSLRYS
jgi:hypothetical protein